MGNDNSRPVDPTQSVSPPICADVEHPEKEAMPGSWSDSDGKDHTDQEDEVIYIGRLSKSELSTTEPDNTKAVLLPICESLQQSAKRDARYFSHDHPSPLELGYTMTVKSAYEKLFKISNPVIRKVTQNDFQLHGKSLLFSMNIEILRVAMNGNLPLELFNGQIDSIKQLYRRDSEWVIRSTLQYAPAVYIRYLVNKKDQQSATPAQYLKVAQRLKDYVSGNAGTFQRAVELDNLRTNRNSSLQSIREGQHWYLQGFISRVMIILTFCEGLRSRFLRLDEEEMDQPLQRPLGYLDYSINPDNRLEEPESLDDSWLHHLVLNAFCLEYGDTTFEYTSITLCYLADRVEAWLAEPLLSLVVDTNIDTGGGFNIIQRGIQSSALELLCLEKEVWKECKTWREAHTDYNVNREKELRPFRDPGYLHYENGCEVKCNEAPRDKKRKRKVERDAQTAEAERTRQGTMKRLRAYINVCEEMMGPKEHRSQELNEFMAKLYSDRMEKLKAKLVKEEAKN